LLLGRKHVFERGQIGITDAVPLTFDVPSYKTVDIKVGKSITIKTSGPEKTQYTVVLACCGDGPKLPPLLKNKKFWEEFTYFPYIGPLFKVVYLI
jgi:hypothetical protein